MAKFFPIGQVMGFLFSLVLTVIAMLVYFTDMSFTTGMIVLLVTAFIQATLQFAVFMHAGETEDRWSIYSNIVYGIGLVVMTVLGTLLILLWDM
ncbi:cytochrome aa3 quinol oxidase subunit IV [Solibacillus sp. MA9]|uniref:Quinol oxidase subunit 4 n=1 Tax=Solibacillus palustris TaxID=2908203 RepID=A0ABS9UDC8_9BACL|nr:cytochrome aa3 quinol oxidase subunit IV [Solibacillus sp. MA9]MCH7322337.1 cytochrome aa3 quinol oxidase subunit IV [Solibacillus sp. MA9]